MACSPAGRECGMRCQDKCAVSTGGDGGFSNTFATTAGIFMFIAP